MSPIPVDSNDPAAYTHFGELLRFLRRRVRLTQRDLSIAVGYNFAHLSRLEQGQRTPNPSAVAATFVPALKLENEPVWAARLIELAQVEHVERVATRQPVESLATTADVPVSVPSTAFALPLLITKLNVPRPRHNRVTRPRLRTLMDEALRLPLTLISAPAGWGKTTLVADWFESVERKAQSAKQPTPNAKLKTQNSHVVWLALDAQDNDPGTFMRYLIAAMQMVAPEVGITALSLLQSSQSPAFDTLLRLMLNDLIIFAHETVLVLDDYDVISTPIIHEGLTWLVEHMPPTLHLMLATRADPPLPLHRLRAHGQLVELRAADLRFTPEEASEFLREVMGLSLAADDIAALESRTEGWIAGLQLAALAMQNRSDLSSFINAFPGSNRFVVEYLAEEVFVRQPSHLQTFLLQTSILNRLCGPLCDAVLGMEDAGSEVGTKLSDVLTPVTRSPIPTSYSQLILDQVERANLFLVPLDDERRWYRYHHLFGDVLRQRLLAGVPKEHVAALYHRAAAWFVQAGLLDEAIYYLLATGATGDAAALVALHLGPTIESGEMLTPRRWLDQLPEETVRSHPALAVTATMLAIAHGTVEDAKMWLQHAQVLAATIATPPNTSIASWLAQPQTTVLLLQAAIARLQGDGEGALRLAHAALAHSAEHHPFLQAWIQWEIAIASTISGDSDAARAILSQLIVAIDPRYPGLHVQAAVFLGQLAVRQGRLREVANVYRQTLQRLSTAGPPIGRAHGQIHLELAVILVESNRLAEAEPHVQAALSLGSAPPNALLLGVGNTLLARIRLVQNNHSAALNALDRATAMTPALHDPFLADLVLTAGYMRVCLLMDQAPDPALIERQQASDSHLHVSVQLAQARVLVKQGQVEKAEAALLPLCEQALATQQMGIAIEGFILLTVSYAARNAVSQAQAALEQALVLAEGEDYVRIFVDEGATMEHLLTDLSRQSSAVQHRSYIQTLLAAFPAEATSTR